MTSRPENERTPVTCAGRCILRTPCLAFAAEGAATVWAIDHNPAPLASLDATTPALTPRTVDVADSSAVAALAAEIGGPEAARAAFVTRQSMGHLGRPEEIAAIVLHPASEDSDHTTGSVLITDGGMTL